MSASVKVKVFLPVGVCSCSYVGFLGRIYAAIKKYSDVVEYYEDTILSETARELGIRTQGVQIGSKVFKGNVTTEEVEEAIRAELQKVVA